MTTVHIDLENLRELYHVSGWSKLSNLNGLLVFILRLKDVGFQHRFSVTEKISAFLTAIETEFEIVHQIPGRIRLRVPKISRDSNYAPKLKQILERDARITDIHLKPNSNSVVISYNLEAFSDRLMDNGCRI